MLLARCSCLTPVTSQSMQKCWIGMRARLRAQEGTFMAVTSMPRSLWTWMAVAVADRRSWSAGPSTFAMQSSMQQQAAGGGASAAFLKGGTVHVPASTPPRRRTYRNPRLSEQSPRTRTERASVGEWPSDFETLRAPWENPAFTRQRSDSGGWSFGRSRVRPWETAKPLHRSTQDVSDEAVHRAR